jgi:hypothetical protein
VAEEMIDSAAMTMTNETETAEPTQPTGGGSIAILIMALSLIALAAFMLYIASQQ